MKSRLKRNVSSEPPVKDIMLNQRRRALSRLSSPPSRWRGPTKRFAAARARWCASASRRCLAGCKRSRMAAAPSMRLLPRRLLWPSHILRPAISAVAATCSLCRIASCRQRRVRLSRNRAGGGHSRHVRGRSRAHAAPPRGRARHGTWAGAWRTSGSAGCRGGNWCCRQWGLHARGLRSTRQWPANLNNVLAAYDATEFAGLHQAFGHPDGRAWAAGDRLVQAELANVLERIAEQGPDAFYRGHVAS